MAVLVAQGAPPDEVLLAVAAETTSLLGADATRLMRHEAPGTVTVIAEYGMHGPLGQRLPVAGSVAELVQRTSRAARVDSYDDRHGLLADLAREEGFHSSVAAPVMAEGSVWGSLVVLWRQRAPSPTGHGGAAGAVRRTRRHSSREHREPGAAQRIAQRPRR